MPEMDNKKLKEMLEQEKRTRRAMLGMLEDIQEQKNIIEKANREWFDAMDSVEDGIMVHDNNRLISRVNRAYKELSGALKYKDIIGKPYWEVFPKLNAPMSSCAKSMETKSEQTEKFTLQDGRIFQSRTYPILDKEGKYSYGVHVFEDITQREHEHQKIKESLQGTIEAVSKMAEMRDPYTAGHQRRVAKLSVAIAKELGLAQETVDAIEIAAKVHDIGKMEIPSEILTKPTKLTNLEYEFIRNHPQAGYDILKDIKFSYPIAKIILQHHEKLDGSGYPNKLKGDEILLEAKIISVADVVEAMASHRPYRASLGVDFALEEIEKHKGVWYEEPIVDACVKLFREQNYTL